MGRTSCYRFHQLVQLNAALLPQSLFSSVWTANCSDLFLLRSTDINRPHSPYDPPARVYNETSTEFLPLAVGNDWDDRFKGAFDHAEVDSGCMHCCLGGEGYPPGCGVTTDAWYDSLSCMLRMFLFICFEDDVFQACVVTAGVGKCRKQMSVCPVAHTMRQCSLLTSGLAASSPHWTPLISAIILCMMSIVFVVSLRSFSIQHRFHIGSRRHAKRPLALEKVVSVHRFDLIGSCNGSSNVTCASQLFRS